MADLAELLRLAREVRANAYAPYSRFAVGAAIETDDGRRFLGTNVENASYGLTLCAERAAVAAAVAAGARAIVAVAVAGPDGVDVSPCGACRQVLAEFAAPEAPLVYAGADGPLTTTVAALLPDAFAPGALAAAGRGAG